MATPMGVVTVRLYLATSQIGDSCDVLLDLVALNNYSFAYLRYRVRDRQLNLNN